MLYQPEREVRLEVRVENETVWLTQAQMAALFERDRSVIAKHIKNCVSINFEKNPEYKEVFKKNLDVNRIVAEISAISAKPIIPGQTLLFLDEVQLCPEAIMSLRFFKEYLPCLHVIAAGSLLEFALQELPTFGVGRIHSMFMHPMTFDEFAQANGFDKLLKIRD